MLPFIRPSFTRLFTRASVALVLGSLLAGCASTSAELMLGAQVADGGFYPGHGATATFRVRHALSERVFCEYEHVSHLLVGPPFGERNEENSLDQVGCGIRFGGAQ